jgi:hypothetical protein
MVISEDYRSAIYEVSPLVHLLDHSNDMAFS